MTNSDDTLDLWSSEQLAHGASLFNGETLIEQILFHEETAEKASSDSTISLFTHENKSILSVSVEQDEFTKAAAMAFDVAFTGESQTHVWSKPDIPSDFGIGLIVGASGSGKSTLLRQFGNEKRPDWISTRAIVSHFSSPSEAIDKLTAVGMNSIPTWLRPYHCLSTGEKFRADLARCLHDHSVIDEFTSVVNRDVACATARALRRYVTQQRLRHVVLASCHRDILEWLEPDWYFDTDIGDLVVGRSLCRPSIHLSLYPGTSNLWPMFAKHHYLSAELNRTARCFVSTWRNNLVGFVAVLPLPSGTVQNAWREHRLVILPDFQGLGIGPRLSDEVARLIVSEGKRYYSRTAHPRLGGYRQRSSAWRATAGNEKSCVPMSGLLRGNWIIDKTRVGYSHEYIGTTS